MKPQTTILSAMALSLSAILLSGCAAPSEPLPPQTTEGIIASAKPGEELAITSLTVPPAAASADRERQGERKAWMEPITLYELGPELFVNKTSEIPSYMNGTIAYWQQSAVDSFNEGHSVTWGDPLLSAMANTANLIPYRYLPDKSIDEQLAQAGAAYAEKRFVLTTESGIVFTRETIDGAAGTAAVEIQVPQWGTYTVMLGSGADSDIQIIRQIRFQRAEDYRPSLASQPLLVFTLSDDAWSQAFSDIPHYSKGSISYLTQETVQSVIEGHSPWRATPLLAAEILTTNLLPEDHSVKEEDIKLIRVEHEGKADETSTVSVKVPDWGVYEITVKYAGDTEICTIARIEFQPE